MSPQFVYGLLTLGVCAIVACRVEKMEKGVTRPEVFAQHFLLGVCSFGSWISGFTEYEDWNTSILAMGILQFFLFSVKRWQENAPDGTTRPGVLEPFQLNQVERR